MKERLAIQSRAICAAYGYLLLLVPLAFTLHAATVNWDSGGDGVSWHDPRNWSGDQLPLETDEAVLDPPSGTPVMFEGGDAVVRRLDLRGTLMLVSGRLAVVETTQVTGTLLVAGGGISTEGGLNVIGGALDCSAGSLEGPVTVRDGALVLGTDANAPATFVLQGACSLSGVVNSGQTLRLQSSVAYGPMVATAAAGLTNKGKIQFECASDNWRDQTVTLAIPGGLLLNTPTGRIDVTAANGNGRSIQGSVRNEGTIWIENGITLIVSGTEPVFAQSGGAVDAEGPLLFEGGRFDWTGGILLGTVRVHDARVSVGEGLTSPSTLRLVGTENRLIRNLSPASTLWVEGHSTWGAARLTAESGAENRGTIQLETSLDDWRDQSARLDCGPDGLVNARGATIRTVTGAGDVRGITGHLINRGRVEAGPETVFTGTLEAAGGTFDGPLRIKDSVLRVTGSPATPTLIDLVGAGNQLETDNLPNTILRVNGTVSYGLARLTLPRGVANHGTITMETTVNDWQDRGSYLCTQNGSLTNSPTGVMEVLAGTGDRRVIEGNLVNQGRIFVEPDTTLEIAGDGPVFVQTMGKVAAEGGFMLEAGRFELLGGALEGTVRALNATILVGPGLTEPSTLRLVGGENRLVGSLSPLCTLWVEGTVAWGAAKLTTEPGAENRGTIHLETSTDDWQDRGSRLDCGVTGMVNAAGSVIRAATGAGDLRIISGRLINRGKVDAQAETEFIGTLEAAGGTYAGTLLVHDSDLAITASPPEPTTILLEGPNNQILTGNLTNTELWVRGNPRFGSGVLRAVRGLANEGVIRLETTANDWVNRGSQLTVEDGMFLNCPGGIVRVNAGQGGPRIIAAVLDNAGVIEIGTSCSLGNAIARHVNRGSLNLNGATVSFTGLTLDNQQPGRITGTGTLDVSNVRFETAGTIVPGASVGTLTVTGTSRLLPSSVVEIEFANSEGGIIHDRIVFNGTAYLQGELRIQRESEVLPVQGTTFPVLGYTAAYGCFGRVAGAEINEALRFDLKYQSTQLLLETVASSSTREDAPQIVRHPLNQEVVRGRSAWLGVMANGAEPLGYQWQFNGADIPGATGSVLRLVSVTPADAGAYRVVVRNQFGSVTSNPATLTVQQSIGTFIAENEAGTTELPAVPGNGVTVDVFNGIGGGRVPDPSHLAGLEPSGTTLSPFIDFPRPGTTVAVGTSFNRFFAETTTPPEQVSGLNAANFILRHEFFLRVSRELDIDPETPDIDLRLGVGSDDGFHLAVGSVFIASVGDRGFGWTYKTVSFEKEGLYPVTLLFAANASGASGLEFAWETATHGNVLVPQSALYRSLTAGQHLITFEELPLGTVVSNQFHTAGIIFKSLSGELQVTTARPSEFVPVSPPNVYADPAVVTTAPVELEFRFVDPVSLRPATVDFMSFFVIDAESRGAVVTVFDSADVEVYRREFHGGGAAREEVLLDQPRMLRVHVYLGESDDTAAIDHITFSSPEPLAQQHFDLAIGQAVVRDVPGPGAGILEFAGEEDWYKFAADAGQSVFFDDHDSSTRRLYWELREPSGELIFVDRLDGTDPEVRTLARTGDYYIRVFGADSSMDIGTYGFKLWSELPFIRRSPQTLTVYAGRDATFSVLAESQFPLQYQWQFDGADIPGATQPVLVLHGVKAADAGVYSVTVSNAVGSVQSDPAILVVDSNVPELTVVNVLAPATGQAGKPVELTWTVTNQGTAAAVGPWAEKILLSTDAVVGGDQAIAVVGITSTLPPGQSLVRTQQVTLPRLGPVGNVWFVVQVDSNDQIPEADEANNVAIADQPIAVTPVLAVQLSRTRLAEGDSAQGTVTRAGDLAAPLTIAITTSPANQVDIPQNVVVPAGHERGTFTLTALADGVVDGNAIVTVEVTAAGYESACATVEVLDMDLPVITMAFRSSTVLEGDRIEGTLSIAPVLDTDTTINLESSSPDQLAVPRSVTIPRGQTNATFSAAAVEDALIESTLPCKVSAFGARFEPAKAVVSIIDNDAPSLQLVSARPSVNEKDGPFATTVTVTRDPLGTLPLRVELESSDISEVVVPASITIPPGVASVAFPIGVTDDSLLDGNRVVEIRAFIVETFTGKRLGQPTVIAIEVIDDESPGLTLSIAHSLVPEGRAPATTGTVRRNTPTDAPMVVQLSSDRPGEAIVPATVVIGMGHTDAIFDVVSIDDGVADGNQNVVITAEASGLATARASLVVSDVNLPDLVINRIEAPNDGLTGASFTVTYRESNFGLAPATGAWVQRLFFSTDPQPGDDIFLGEVAFAGTVGPDLYLERTLQYRFPTTPGDYWLVVAADADDTVSESLESNNTAVSVLPIRVTAAYTATVQTDIEVAPANAPVPLRGRAIRTGSSAPAAFELVNVHLTVRGTRRVIAALTDAQGNFNATFHPLPGEAGHYEIGAAHPGEKAAPVQDSFTLVGMQFEPSELTIDLSSLSSSTGHVTIANLTEIGLTGITHTPSPVPPGIAVEWTLPTAIPPDGKAVAVFRADSLDQAPLDAGLWIDVSSTQGAQTRLPIRIRVKPLQPRLTASPGTLVAGMVRGDQTLVTFQVRNDGGAATGPLQVLLPTASWLGLASSLSIPPIEAGASCSITLQLIPPSDMPLTEYPGALMITDGQASVSVPFRFRAFSDATGALRVGVEDEYTYYAAGTPRVAGARLVVTDALSKQKVAEATTDNSGWASFPALREGYYEIEGAADDHNPNRATILVVAGDTTESRLFLPRHTVQYIWHVEPTQIEDHTRITIEAVFETEVPVPVITIDPPIIDLADVAGEIAQVDLKITNHGLVAAEAMRLQFDANPRWEIKPLIEHLGTLPARSSITVPVLIRRLTGGAKLLSAAPQDSSGQAQLALPDPIDQGCAMGARLLWELLCGPNRNLYSRAIHIANVGGGCPYGGLVPLSASGGGCRAFLGSTAVVATDFNCHPCAEKAFEALLKCAAKFIPMKDWIKCVRDQNKCVRSYWQGGWIPSAGTLYQCGKAQLVCVKAAGVSVPGLSYLKYFECIHSLLTICEEKPKQGLTGLHNGINGLDPAPTWQLPPIPQTIPELQSVRVYLDRAKRAFEAEAFLFGDIAWLEIEDVTALAQWLQAFDLATEGAGETDWAISESERVQLLELPSAEIITPERVTAFVDRWNRSIAYWADGIFRVSDVPQGQSTDFIALDQWADVAEAADLAADLSVADGFEDQFDGLQAMIDQAIREFSQPNEGICATVRITIDHDAVLTRDAFKASLDLINRSPSEIEGVRIDLGVQDSSGTLVTDRFVIQPPALDGISATDGSGRVLPGTAGRAVWLIVPTSDAAPDRARTYFVVGTLAYSQDGVEVRVPLAPSPITVHPSPSLSLQYFHQRDVLGDDPFTDIIEPSIPYSLAVLVRNRGAGVARNFRITSAQPKIVENEKGLLIEFEILATEVAGQNLTPSLTANFGDVPPGGIAIGRWLFRSSLQGLFVDYAARFEHVDGLGDPRLSLIDNVEIHELVRIVHAPGASDDGLPDMLANDFPDDLDLPDTLYLSDGSVHAVNVIRNAFANRAPDPDNLTVQVTAGVSEGWVYLRLPDPAQGKYRLIRVQRPDGTEISIDDNAWVTDRTFIGGGHLPVYEHILHILDLASTGAYTLTYALPPELDMVPPSSHVATLPQFSYETIPVSWNGSDNPNGVGIDHFDVFVAVDGGQYTPWLTRTRLTGALYQGVLGHTYAFYSRATDVAGNTENAPAMPDATTTVTLRNTPPTLVVPESLVVIEGTEVVITATASDTDLPQNNLTFDLAHGAPPGATIVPDTGLLRWITTEADGPGQFQITVRVTDNGTPPLTTTKSTVVTVLETNQPPILDHIPDFSADEGQLIEFAATARDLDWPPNKLQFSLNPQVPAGASVNPASGVFTWRPSPTQGPSTNLITLTVSDDGDPSLSASRSFTVVVNDMLSDFVVLCGITNVLAGNTGSLLLQLDTIADLRQIAFDLYTTGETLQNVTLAPLGAGIATSLQPIAPGRWRCQFDAPKGGLLAGAAQTIGQLTFNTAPEAKSDVARVSLGAFEAVRASGEVVRHGRGRDGLVIVIGDQPVLQVNANLEFPLVLYGRPGHSYDVQACTALPPSESWFTFRQVRLEGTYNIMARPMPNQPVAFHRAIESAEESLRIEIHKMQDGSLTLFVFAPAGRDIVLESTTELAPGQVWTEEKRLRVEHASESIDIIPAASQRLYRARLGQP